MEERDYTEEPAGNIMQSVVRYEELLKNNSPLFFDEQTFEELIEYFELNGKLKKGIEVCDYAVSIYPFSSVFMLKKASLLMQHRQYAESLALLDKAETIDPGDIGIALLRSDIYLQKSQHSTAIDIITKALATASKDDVSELCLEMADVYEAWGRYDKVFEYLKKSLEADSHNEEALNRMWYSVELSRKFDESIEFHNKLIDESPYNYLAWQNLGHAYYGLGLFEKAIDCYEFTIAINDQYDLGYRDCGEAWFALKQYRKAIAHFQKAIYYSKPFEDLYFCIGECYERLKDYNKARLYFRKAIHVEPKFHGALYRIGITYKKEKLWENAQLFFKKALMLNPDRVPYLVGLAQSAFQLGNEEALINVCNRILNLNPRNRSRKTYEKLITFLIHLNCVDQAEVLIEHAMMEKGSLPNFLLMKSICQFINGRRREGISLLESGLILSGDRRNLLFKLLPNLQTDKEIAEIIDIYR